MADDNLIRRRIIAVLDYDRVATRRRVSHLSAMCGISQSTARRILQESSQLNFDRSRTSLAMIVRGLDVSWSWLYNGEFRHFHQRTLRIHIHTFLHYPKVDTDRIMRMFVGCIAGHRKAVNLLDLVVSEQLTAVAAARLM